MGMLPQKKTVSNIAPDDTETGNVEHQKVLGIAREYRQQGCEVQLYPAQTDLPEALAGCNLSLVAKCDGKMLAVAVRTKETLTQTGEKDLRRISDRIQSLPDWEFELVVTGSRSLSS